MGAGMLMLNPWLPAGFHLWLAAACPPIPYISISAWTLVLVVHLRTGLLVSVHTTISA